MEKKTEEKKPKEKVYKTEFQREQQKLQTAARAEKVLVLTKGANRAQRRQFR